MNRVTIAALISLSMLSMGTKAADPIDTLATAYRPEIIQTTDAGGFRHPGVGLTAEVLENMRRQVLAKQEPWHTHFNNMLRSSSASRTAGSSNQGADSPLPLSDAFDSRGINSRFIADGLKAYTQAILYYVTGDEIYRANTMRILRIWSRMNPAKYVYFPDAHIHTGIPLNRMVAAAELMRHTSSPDAALAWTAQDTADFSANLITPVIETFQHKNSHFMNQHLYPLIGAMSGYIFTGDRARYNEGVEWFTVNRTGIDQGRNGAIKRLFRLVDKNDLTGEPVNPPLVQHVEMGRDQAHGAGDITNAEILARLLMAQGTKVDPVNGTASTAPNAVGPYEFLDDRILDAAEYFARYMLGLDTPWHPTAAWADPDGTPTIIYKQLSSNYRGRLTQNHWELYYYYKYIRGVDMEQRAPHFSDMYSRRVAYNWDGVDGGGDFWIFMPAAAAAEGPRYLVRPINGSIREIEDRFTPLDQGSSGMRDETAGFARVQSSAAGTRIALTGYANNGKNLAFRFRTNGPASMDAFGAIIVLPDTRGEWRYAKRTLNEYQSLGDMLFLTIKGAGTQVDLDHIDVSAAALDGPAFAGGEADQKLHAYTGSASPLHYRFATAAGTAASCQADNLPQGAGFNTGTGEFSWKPVYPGTYTFVVSCRTGNVVAAKLVTVTVSADRTAALAAAGSRKDTPYTRTTLAAYEAARADAAAALRLPDDAAFIARLNALGAAATGLRKLTPLIGDGSMDYSGMLAASTFGSSVPNALDGQADTFVVYTQAVNRTHTLDFGAGYKVAARGFGLQVRASFPDRIGGIAIFGSNDNENWTRLTPGLTAISEEMQTLAVQENLRNAAFRYLKIQMVRPSSTMLELSEFRIYGTRYEE